MQCAKCGQEVPADAIYCPHCTGDRKTTDKQVMNGGFKGALIGFCIGLLPAIWLLYQYGAVRGIKAIVVILPVTGLATGLVFGLVRAKREWK